MRHFADIRLRFPIVKCEIFSLFSRRWTRVFVPLSDSFAQRWTAGKQAILLVFTAWLMPRKQMVFRCFSSVSILVTKQRVFWYRESALPDFATQFLDFEGRFSLFVKNIRGQKGSVYPPRKRSVNIAKCGILLIFACVFRSLNAKFSVCFPDGEVEFSFHCPTVFHHGEQQEDKPFYWCSPHG